VPIRLASTLRKYLWYYGGGTASLIGTTPSSSSEPAELSTQEPGTATRPVVCARYPTNSWFNPQPLAHAGDNNSSDVLKTHARGIVFILVVCLVCPLVELFDRWDHTIQTGTIRVHVGHSCVVAWEWRIRLRVSSSNSHSFVVLQELFSLPASRNLSFPCLAVSLYCFLMRRVPSYSHYVSEICEADTKDAEE